MQMKNTNLNNIENYNSKLESNEHILFLKYVGLIHEFIQGCGENLFIQKEEYLKHILINGIKNIHYIYTIMILYTKNTELTIYHIEKAIIYYIEFISQIGEDSNNLLKLNSKDATLFIYKKTIFEISDDYRKTYVENEETDIKMDMLHRYIGFYNNILVQIITTFDFKNNSLEDLQNIVFIKLYKNVDAIIQLHLIYKKNPIMVKHKLEKVHSIISIFNNSYSYRFISKNYLYLIEFFIKKIHKIEIDTEYIKKKINNMDNNTIIQDYSVCKIFNYLME